MNSFEEINDYDYYLLPREVNTMPSDYQNVINKHFDFKKDKDGNINNKDLILCLIETVTLNDSNAIGKTLVRAQFQGRSIIDYIDKYKEIVKKIKKTPGLVEGISKYNEWYNRNSYIFLHENKDHNHSDKRPSDWRTPPEIEVKKNEERKLYADLEEKLTEEDILKYLNYYSKVLLEELDFRNYPNVCFIVKPIAVTDGVDHIALGNLYMHFATNTPKSKYFYTRIINDYMRVWYKVNGFEVITEISDYNLNSMKLEVLKSQVNNNFIPDFKNLKGSDRLSKPLSKINSKTIIDFYNELYLNIKIKVAFEKELFDKCQKVITFLIKHQDDFIKDENVRCFDLKKISPKCSVKGLRSANQNLKYFADLLIFREIYKIGILLFNLEPKKFQRALKDGIYSMVNDKYGNSEYAYLWTERFIPFIQNSNYEKNKHNIKNLIEDSLCEIEKAYLKKYMKMKKKSKLESN
ncbi:hypothetical protein GCM10011344_27600 [Dokdonia pacifica]|uniref:Uncharacterized protein n=1 Tax=Dokdonia pacifica TaxID=1627892 RepID=A0A239CE86_9FLAO|nr:hypothetical protein [Dokdonia pacifica]GGG25429.1 hypothetical protein GCM10011344_27600 [Dokdonia pacifica]SNS18545.1 hypothetical protein SAMN06265376_107285 [Dokdonia pacifica]